MKRVLVLLVFSAVFFLGRFFVFAEDVDIQKIVVTPSRIEEDYSSVPRTVDVISKESLENNQVHDISEALSALTSVNVNSYGGVGASKTVRMRGSSASQVLVLVDGRPINSPRDGEVDFSSLPVENIDRVEVVHGPSSNIYGSSAMGGTINVITRRPPQKGMETEIASSIGTYRTFEERMLNAARIGKFGYLISGAYLSSEGIRDNSEFSAKDCNTNLEYAFSDSHRLNFRSGFFTSKTGTPGLTSSVDIDDSQKTLKRYYDLDWKYADNEQFGLSTKLFHNYDRLEFNENSAGSVFDTPFSKFAHTTTQEGVNQQIESRLFEKYLVIGGFNYVFNKNNSSNSGKHTYNLKAGYLENQFSFTEQLKLTLGGRIDDYSNFGSEFNPNASLVFAFNDRSKIFTSLSRSFRAPTFNDLYWPDEGWAKGNPQLKPETCVSGEIGFEVELTNYLKTGLTYYRNDFNDLIQWAEAAGVWMPLNVGSAEIDGAEFSNTITINEFWQGTLGYTFLHAINDKTNKNLIYQPRHKIDAAVTFKPVKGLMVTARAQFVDKRYHDAANTIKVKRYHTFGLDVSKKITENASAYLSFDNMADKHYETVREYPVAGFSCTGKVKVSF